jgi:hypothetical protein
MCVWVYTFLMVLFITPRIRITFQIDKVDVLVILVVFISFKRFPILRVARRWNCITLICEHPWSIPVHFVSFNNHGECHLRQFYVWNNIKQTVFRRRGHSINHSFNWWSSRVVPLVLFIYKHILIIVLSLTLFTLALQGSALEHNKLN